MECKWAPQCPCIIHQKKKECTIPSFSLSRSLDPSSHCVKQEKRLEIKLYVLKYQTWPLRRSWWRWRLSRWWHNLIDCTWILISDVFDEDQRAGLCLKCREKNFWLTFLSFQVIPTLINSKEGYIMNQWGRKTTRWSSTVYTILSC